MSKFGTYINIPMMRFFKFTIIVYLLVACCAPLCLHAQTPTDDRNSAGMIPPVQRGAALGLYSEDPDWSYVDMIDEMKEAGVTHVAIVVPYYMKTNEDTKIFKHPRYSVPMHTVERTIKDVRKRQMNVFLFPILRVEDKSNGGWRGTLAPSDIDLFFSNYTAYILTFAKLAERLNIPLMSIGSELSTMDVHTKRWEKIIKEIRNVYSGNLTYSANWDHYEKVKFFNHLDYAGVTGYFELTDKNQIPEQEPTVEQLIHSWREVYMDLMRWQHELQKPLIFTEVGYLSQKGTAARPWNEGADEALDLDIQRRCYEAFIRVWNDEPRLAGNYFWNWFGWGGETSKEYTPRNKPAAQEIKKWYMGTSSSFDSATP